MSRLRSLWLALGASLWFVPTVLVVGSIAAALFLIDMQSTLDRDLATDWPRLFGAGAEGARGMLSAIATSMITVAGVVFSVTIVALSLTASQYSPRVLRNFMSDRPTQFVLGAFVSVFAYCLIVLRTIRGGDDGGAFVPSVAVLGGVVMAFIGIALLIYFVHHVATAIQVSYIVQRIATDTLESIDRVFPDDQGDGDAHADETMHERDPLQLPGGPWFDVLATRTGYLVAFDTARIVKLASECDTVLRVRQRVGAFVVQGTPVAEVAGDGIRSGADWCRIMAPCFTVDAERNVEQDPAYGLQQLVDVGLKALSPSVHDPTTALICVDHLGALLQRLSARRIEGLRCRQDGRLRLVAEVPAYEDFVRLALAAITHHAGSHDGVHARLMAAVGSAASETVSVSRLAALERQLSAHLERLEQCDLGSGPAGLLRLQASTLRRQLEQRMGPWREPGGKTTATHGTVSSTTSV